MHCIYYKLPLQSILMQLFSYCIHNYKLCILNMISTGLRSFWALGILIKRDLRNMAPQGIFFHRERGPNFIHQFDFFIISS